MFFCAAEFGIRNHPVGYDLLEAFFDNFFFIFVLPWILTWTVYWTLFLPPTSV